MRTKRHVKNTPIRVENYLRNDMSKTFQLQTIGKLNKLVVHFAELYKHKKYKYK